MPTDEFTPDLGSLHDDFQILTELRRSASSCVFLARNLKLNRDVTITVLRASTDGERAAMSRFADDARTLTVMRHRNVIPVIEARWLDDGSFAIARARVRGSTLDHIVSSAGRMPLSRVASTLEQVSAALEWARANDIAHRYVAGAAIVFQQGSGRVLLELDPSASGTGVEQCDDARTLGRLAYEMLSGRADVGSTARPLVEARPDLTPAIVRETESLMHCDAAGEPRDVTRLIRLLGGASSTPSPTPRARTPVVPLFIPGGPLDDAVIVVKRGPSFNARLVSAVAVVTIIAALGIVVVNRRDSLPKMTASAPSSMTDTVGEAAGDVTESRPSADSVSLSRRIMTPSPTSPATPAAPILPPVKDSLTRGDLVPATARPLPPATRRSEPPMTDPRLTVPPVSAATPVGDTSSDRDVCASSGAGDQHTCLVAAIERNDEELNRLYGSLIAAYRRQAGVSDTDPDPSPVDDLRAAERQWLDTRDVACADVGVGPLYARARAQCFAEQSAARKRELAATLAAIQPK